MRNKTKDKFIGSFLGMVIGDILGAPFEGWSSQLIKSKFGEIHDFVNSDRGFGCYTDDTQMAIALADSIIRSGKVNQEDCAQRYAEFFQPNRGYSSSTARTLSLIKNNKYIEKNEVFRYKSSNGGAMHIAPVGLVYRKKKDETLRQVVNSAVCCTHTHPEAIDGAAVQARAVGELVKVANLKQFKSINFLERIMKIAKTKAMKKKLYILFNIIKNNLDVEKYIPEIGNGTRAVEAVTCSLLATLKYYCNPEMSIIKSVGFGGDTDTIGAMTGAQIGAIYGSGWIPDRWFNNIENGRYGRDYIIGLAERLSEVCI